MKINELQKTPAASICRIEGEVNINTSGELRKFCSAIIDRKIPTIVFDMSNVPYIDSSGLATLVEMLQRLKRQGGSLKLAGLQKKVRDLFEVTKLEKLFEIFDSLEKAKETIL